LAKIFIVLVVLGWTAGGLHAVWAEDSYKAALSLFWEGRRLENLETHQAESQLAFQRSLAMTERLLSADPANSDLQTLKTWNLFRLHRYTDTVVYAQSVLNTRQDYRIIETMAEALYFLGKTKRRSPPSAAISPFRPTTTTAVRAPIIMWEKYILE